MERNSQDVLHSKRKLRKDILNIRDNLSMEEREWYSRQIRERVVCHASYREAQVILAYASYLSEVDTMMLIEQALADGKHVFVPKVAGEDMEFWQITSTADLHAGYRGIPEPVQGISFPEWLAGRAGSAKRQMNIDKKMEQDRIENKNKIMIMMWMPGAVFDRERHRIGYGKGFYDRYLSRLSDESRGELLRPEGFQLITAALSYSCQVVRQIPYEPHDIKPDMVVTEKEIFR